MQQIKDSYGDIINLAATRFQHRPEVIAGIIQRESNGKSSVIGDRGHGFGLMQIDNRSFPDFCNNLGWSDPLINIDKGALILKSIRAQVIKECTQFELTASESDIERMSIAGYNCGADNAVHCFRHNLDIDAYTTGKDYSKSVLAYAEIYKSLVPLNTNETTDERSS